LIAACLTKVVINHIIGFVYDMKPLTINDNYYLYDFPANPCGVPSFVVFKRPDPEKWGCPEEQFD